MKNEFNFKFYNSIKFLLNQPFKLIFNPKVEGLQNIPNKPYILIGNHISFLDIPLLIVSIPDDIHFMAKKELFKNCILNNIFRKMGAFPVDRENVDVGAIKMALKILKSEEVLGIFPEGTRNKTGKILLPFKSGCSTLASKSKTLILPFGISGEYKRNNIKLNIGRAINIENIAKDYRNEYLEEKVKQLILK